MSDPRMTGKMNKIAGETFERWISNACEFYKEKEMAVIEKTPEAMKPLRSVGKGQFIACFEKKCQPDYKGVLCDGTGIVFEAKHTDNDRIQQTVVTSWQADSLNDYEKMGAQCFVMVSMGLTEFYRVPWQIWRSMKENFGRKYMTEQDLHPYRLQKEQSIIKILEGVELRDES